MWISRGGNHDGEWINLARVLSIYQEKRAVFYLLDDQGSAWTDEFETIEHARAFLQRVLAVIAK